MNLKEYFIIAGIKKYKFAEILGVSDRTLRRIMSGSYINPVVAQSIEIYTDGKVKAETLLRKSKKKKAL